MTGVSPDTPKDAYVGIDVAFAKRKYLPVAICVRHSGCLFPLPLADPAYPKPPRGRGNRASLDPAVIAEFAEETVTYVREIERQEGLNIRRIALDAPSQYRRSGDARRAAERAMDNAGISCFTTPDAQQFERIREKALAHLRGGGAENQLPHANQLWMLVGFELFGALGKIWECRETYPQAIIRVLGVRGWHKSRGDSAMRQLAVASRWTGWPVGDGAGTSLMTIGHGARHDRVDAYLTAWVASLEEDQLSAYGQPPGDVIWVPRITPDAGPMALTY